MFAAIGIWRFCQGLKEKPAEINLQSITICVTKNDRNSTTRWYVSACWASNHGGISSEEFTTMSNAVMVKPLRLRSRRSVRPLYLAWNFTKNRAICSRRVEWYCLIFCWVLGSRNVQKCLFLWHQLPCPNQSHPLSLQRVPHWKCSKTGDHSRRRWENSAGWWSGRHPSCQCQGYQPIPNASELVGFKNFKSQFKDGILWPPAWHSPSMTGSSRQHQQDQEYTISWRPRDRSILGSKQGHHGTLLKHQNLW